MWLIYHGLVHGKSSRTRWIHGLKFPFDHLASAFPLFERLPSVREMYWVEKPPLSFSLNVTPMPGYDLDLLEKIWRFLFGLPSPDASVQYEVAL